MKTFLLYANQDFDWARPTPWNEKALTQDLDLAAILDSMSRGTRTCGTSPGGSSSTAWTTRPRSATGKTCSVTASPTQR